MAYARRSVRSVRRRTGGRTGYGRVRVSGYRRSTARYTGRRRASGRGRSSAGRTMRLELVINNQQAAPAMPASMIEKPKKKVF